MSGEHYITRPTLDCYIHALPHNAAFATYVGGVKDGEVTRYDPAIQAIRVAIPLCAEMWAQHPPVGVTDMRYHAYHIRVAARLSSVDIDITQPNATRTRLRRLWFKDHFKMLVLEGYSGKPAPALNTGYGRVFIGELEIEGDKR